MIQIGTAAGISAIFNTTITGVVFALEEVIGTSQRDILGGVLVGSVAAAVVERALLGGRPLLAAPFSTWTDAREMVGFALLGVIAGVTSGLAITLAHRLKHRWSGWRTSSRTTTISSSDPRATRPRLSRRRPRPRLCDASSAVTARSVRPWMCPPSGTAKRSYAQQEASRRSAYTITDRSTFEAAGTTSELLPVLERTPLLHHHIEVLLARSERPHRNAEWLVQ